MTTRPLHTLIQYLRQQVRRPGDIALTDAQLLERWTGRRDQAAFELLLWRHGPMVLSTCRRLLRRGEDAEDAFQATFLVLVRKAHTIRRREALAAWLHRVARRVALRVRTATVRQTQQEKTMVDIPAAPDRDDAGMRDLRAVLDTEIDRLPPHYRRAFILCCLEGRTQEEAARQLDCPRGTVSSWLTRARERLRQRLIRRGVSFSVAGLTALLGRPAQSAAVPAPLVDSTFQAAVAVSAGQGASTALISPRAVALTEGMLRAMLMTKLKIAVAVLFVVALFAAGIGTLPHPTRAADPPVARIEEESPRERNVTPPFPKEPADGIAWNKTIHGLQAGIAFRPGDERKYRVGESVTFVVYLRNVSAKEIRLSHVETLFAEVMPTVEDADGNRIRVAAGPVNLGQVPIVQRSVNPGQRITLGYPWFRIRPVGWRGEILGPICCAAPGRYKVGYAGLPLRQGDDKADSSSPATGQVELDIQGDEVGKPDRTLKGLIPTAAEKTSGRSRKASMLYVNRRDLKVPFQAPPSVQGRIRAVKLYVSRDGGQTFQFWQDTRWQQEQPRVSSFSFHALEDGVYDLATQTEGGQGRLEPSDIRRARSELTICVDTTPPVVEIGAIDSGKGSVVVRWKVSDQNLDLSSLQLLYRHRNEKTRTESIIKPANEGWTEVAIKPATEGMHEWDDLPDGAELEVRLRVLDKAGNYSAVVAPIKLRKRE